MFSMDGKVALVTGGAGGIGEAVVRAYLEAGARVGILDRNQERLEAVVDELGKDVVGVHGSVEKMADNVRAVQTTVDAFGGLTTFVGNAGVGAGNLSLAELPVDKLEDAIDEIFAINVRGYLLGARAALPEVLKANGSMIFSTSLAGYRAVDDGVLYVATKHANVGTVRQLAWEFAPRVRVNGVAIGVAKTNMEGLEVLDQPTVDAVLPGAEQVIPLERIPEAADHAGAFVYLASDQASVATGECIWTDSGFGIRGIGSPRGGSDLDPQALAIS